ncbi:MAG: hypothetical protein ACRYG7_53660 [Janthinobacterium lividum]
MQLLYLVFGTNIQNHFQAHFSILTFLRQEQEELRITVMTDAPEFYRHLGAAIVVEVVEAATLREWEGEYKFFWRVKIKALEHAARQRPELPLLYLDSDTFLYGSLPALRQQLAAGQALMHELEGLLSQLPSKTERRMWQQVQGQLFGGVAITPQHAMWNAGAVGIPVARSQEAIALALSICDNLCRQGVTPRLIEQFALSVALAETYGLHAARPYIGHYWSTKSAWNEPISRFLLTSHLQNRTLAQDLAALDAIDFQALPIKHQVRNTQSRLENLTRRLLPPRNVEYLG